MMNHLNVKKGLHMKFEMSYEDIEKMSTQGKSLEKYC